MSAPSMPAAATCGVWATHRRLVAVLLHGTEARSLITPRTDDGRWSLMQRVAELPAVELVVTTELLRSDAFAELAARAGVGLWCAPVALADALRAAGGTALGSPRAAAAMLARLPGIALLRPQLRRVAGAADPRQLRLV